MLSAIFVDRPRFAIVIAIVTTIAGLLALLAIPVAQYPDIVPPQVSVTTIYPGASGAVVDATVAQPIEAQVVGVDKMIYMKSVSGNDGSYSLIVLVRARHRSRHQHRQRQQPRAGRAVAAAAGSAAPGRDGQEEILGAARRHRRLLARRTRTIRCSCPTTSRSTCSTRSRARRASATPSLWGPQDYAMRAWVQDRPADRPQPDDRRHHQRHPGAERAGGRRAHRRAADLRRPAAAAQHPDQGPPDHRRRSSRTSSSAPIRTARCCACSDVARLELGAANLDRETRFNGAPAAAIAIYQSPGANAITTLEGGRASCMPELREALSRGSRLEDHLRSDRLRHRHDPRSAEDADRGLRSRRASSSSCSSAACAPR